MIVSVAEDIGGIKAAGPWIEKANPSYTVLVDEKHIVSSLYGMVNVPTAVWIDEQGHIVRPNEVAYVDNRFTSMHKVEAKPYLEAIRDWTKNGAQSIYAMKTEEVRRKLTPPNPDFLLADANFHLAQYMISAGHDREAIPYFKNAQKLNPDSWNYKRQAWLLADPDKDYGTNFGKEVQKLGSKPYYAPRELPAPPQPKQQ